MVNTGPWEWVLLLFYNCLWGLIMIPSIIAVAQDKTNKTKILLINIFLWWTVVGWIIVLVWSIKNPHEKHES